MQCTQKCYCHYALKSAVIPRIFVHYALKNVVIPRNVVHNA